MFTGLAASGKSTIAHNLEKMLFEEGVNVYVLDGDNIRHGLNADLGFSINDRRENLRRVAEVSKLLIDAGMIVLASFVAPFKRDREYIQSKFDREDFVEVYVRCPVEICEERDPKGLYKKARMGIINNYTGINAPYEEPENPHILIHTDRLSISDSVNIIHKYLFDKGWLCTSTSL